MKFLSLFLIFYTFYVYHGECATPTVNPECQSLADLINFLKQRLDQIPLNLVPIPGLDPSKKTTLQCYEYQNCNGFNCSGKIYGRHMQFSFNLNYCTKPVTANITAAYPAENITIVRNIKHADEFFITKISFVIPTINVTVPVKLFGKISMTRSPGKVTVTAGIIPKLDVPSPIVPPPFNILNNRVINVDTTRCGDEIPPGGTTMMTKTSNVGGATNQPIGQSSPLSGGDIAAIIMSIVAFVAIVVAVTLYWKRHIIFKRYALENDKGNSNVAI